MQQPSNRHLKSTNTVKHFGHKKEKQKKPSRKLGPIQYEEHRIANPIICKYLYIWLLVHRILNLRIVLIVEQYS